jgi:anaerobic carbon-monoxide dehydrogenase iron sulfur subunit
METIFVNLERCIGCRQCELACAVEHSKSRDPFRAVFEQPAPSARIFVEAGARPDRGVPVRCRHCDPAPCQTVCPTGAIFRDEVFGLVQLGADKCITCAMCAMVCPFDVVTFHAYANGQPARVVATKCDGCIERRQRGAEPACVEVCKTGALTFGDLNQTIREKRERSSAALITEEVSHG